MENTGTSPHATMAKKGLISPFFPPSMSDVELLFFFFFLSWLVLSGIFAGEGREGGNTMSLVPVFQAFLAIQAAPLRDHMLLTNLWVQSQSPFA